MIIELWYIWTGLGVLAIIAEIFIRRFLLLSIGLASIFAGLTSLLSNSIVLQVFVLISLTFVNYLLITTVGYKVLKPVDKGKKKIPNIKGKACIVVSRITPDKQGTIAVGDDKWPALPEGDISIESNKIVIVSAIKSNIAIVKQEKKTTH